MSPACFESPRIDVRGTLPPMHSVIPDPSTCAIVELPLDDGALESTVFETQVLITLLSLAKLAARACTYLVKICRSMDGVHEAPTHTRTHKNICTYKLTQSHHTCYQFKCPLAHRSKYCHTTPHLTTSPLSCWTAVVLSTLGRGLFAQLTSASQKPNNHPPGD